MTTLSTFNENGPEYPECGAVPLPDEASYFNESGYEIECDACGISYEVTPLCSWMWRTKTKEREP